MTDTNDNSTTDNAAEGPLLKNRYRLGRVLGRGGMCIVYQAWDTRLERNVAVKRLDPALSQIRAPGPASTAKAARWRSSRTRIS